MTTADSVEASGPPSSPSHGPRTAIVSFATAVVLVLVVYVGLFDVSKAVERGVFAALVIAGLAVAIRVHRLAIPTSRLPHAEKVRREQRHLAAGTGVLVAVLVALVYVAALGPGSWADWTVLGVICLTAVGGGIAVQTRLR
jgi:hypothetical protein